MKSITLPQENYCGLTALQLSQNLILQLKYHIINHTKGEETLNF